MNHLKYRTVNHMSNTSLVKVAPKQGAQIQAADEKRKTPAIIN